MCVCVSVCVSVCVCVCVGEVRGKAGSVKPNHCEARQGELYAFLHLDSFTTCTIILSICPLYYLQYT